MAIIISENGKNAQRLDEVSFELEDKLQQYIADNPGVIPLYDIDQDIRLLILAREFPTESGPIDAVGIDQAGNIYLIETKLFKNPDKRKVVAQVLDYGASIWRSAIDFSEFTELLSRHCKQLFNMTLDEKLADFFAIDETQTEELLEQVKINLSSASFKFVVLMDKLERRLKDLIIFLNQNSQFDVFAVELEYYKKDQFEIIIPKIHGAEVKKAVTSNQVSGKRKKWDEASFLADLQTRLKDSSAALKLYEYSKQTGDVINWGTGIDKGSANVIFKAVSHRSAYSLYSDGTLQLNFGWLDDPLSVPYRDSFRKALTDRGILKTEHLNKYWISIGYDDWLPKVEAFIGAVETSLLNRPATQI